MLKTLAWSSVARAPDDTRLRRQLGITAASSARAHGMDRRLDISIVLVSYAVAL